MGKRYCIVCGEELPEMAENCPNCGAITGKKREETTEERQYREFKEQQMKQEYFFQQQKEQMEEIKRQNEELKRQMQQMNQPKRKKGVNILSFLAAALILVGLFLPFMSSKEEDNYGEFYSVETDGTIFQWINLLSSNPEQRAYYKVEAFLTGESESDTNTIATVVGAFLFITIVVFIIDSFKPIKLMKGMFAIACLGVVIIAAIMLSDAGDEQYNITLSCSIGFYLMIAAGVLALFSFLTYPETFKEWND